MLGIPACWENRILIYNIAKGSRHLVRDTRLSRKCSRDVRIRIRVRVATVLLLNDKHVEA